MGRKKLCENRSELILEAASRLFAEVGYQKTTLDEIAHQAGIGKGSIYLEFDSKEDILFALVLQNKAAQLIEMEKIAARSEQSPLSRLKALLVKYVGDAFDAVKRNRLSPETVVSSRDRLRLRLKPFLNAREQLMEQLLREAERQQEIVLQPDSRRLAKLMLLSLRGVLPPYEPSARKVKLQHEAAELLELIFSGLRAEPQSAGK